MATFKSVNRSLVVPGPNFAPVTGGKGGGRVCGFYDTFVLPASGFANGDNIEFGIENTFKKGDIFLDFAFWHEAMGASVVAAVGDDGSSSRFASALDVAALATAAKKPNLYTGIGYEFTQDRPLLITLSGATPTASKGLKLWWWVLRS